MYGAPMSVTPKASYSKMMRDFQRQHGGVHKNRTIATVILLLLIPTFFLLRGGMGPMNCGVASHFPGSTAPRGSRIAMAAFSTNAASYLFLVLKNRYHYAKRHGYDVYFDYEAEGDRGPTWHKFNMVERLIKHGGYDWIWFLDLDALITNTDVQLTSVIADALATAARPSDVDLIINDDCNGFNSGSFIARSSPRTLQMIDLMREVHDELKDKNTEYMDEQEAFNMVFKSNHTLTDNILVVPQKTMNGFPPEINCVDETRGARTWQVGDFVLHFAGAWAHIDRKDPVGYLMRKYEGRILWGPSNGPRELWEASGF